MRREPDRERHESRPRPRVLCTLGLDSRQRDAWLRGDEEAEAPIAVTVVYGGPHREPAADEKDA